MKRPFFRVVLAPEDSFQSLASFFVLADGLDFFDGLALVGQDFFPVEWER